MNSKEQERRSFLYGLTGLGVSQVLARGMNPAQRAAPQATTFIGAPLAASPICC